MARVSKVQLRLGERVVAEVAFEGAELRIGRMKENDLVINNVAVSRFHAVLRRVGDAFEIEDLGSENGTLVDGVAISGSREVPEEAAITIGKHTLQLVAGGAGTTQPPVPKKSDVWDAAQTYFVGGPPSASDAEEPVAEAMEAEGGEEAMDAVPAIEEPEPLEAVLEDEGTALDARVEAVAAAPEVLVADFAPEALVADLAPEALVADLAPEALVADLAPEPPPQQELPLLDAVPEPPPPEAPLTALPEAPLTALSAAPLDTVSEATPREAAPERPVSEPVPETPLLEVVAEPPLAEAVPDTPPVETEGDSAVPEAGPQALELPDPDDALGFDEEEVVGGAMPDPVAAAAPDAVLEAEEVPPAGMETALVPEAPAGPDVLEAAGQTSLFDFGLNEDLGLSDRSLARAAASGPVAVEPARETPGAEATAGTLHAGLIVERGGRVARVVAWDAVSLLVGRAPECGLVLGGSGVSRRHAELTREAGGYGIRDLGSANGVFVNGTRVETVALAQGDVIRIDDHTLTFVLDREPIGESVQSDAAREAAPHAMPERDLVLAEDAGAEVDETDKQLEVSAEAAVRFGAEAEPLVWAFEVAVATARLPEALRRALEEMDAAELVLPAQLRLVRRD